MPRVSIIVPSYNHARYFDSCWKSVREQTMEDWELIVVDDGSSDDSVARWRAVGDARVKVHENEKNLGTYATQNRAVSLAESDLIAVLNSDDTWEPTKLELQLLELEKHPAAPLCYTLGWLANENLIKDDQIDHHQYLPHDSPQELFPHLIAENRVFASSVIFRKSFAQFDESLPYSGDWTALMFASFESPAAFVDERLSCWRIHGLGTHRVHGAVTKEHIRLRRAILARSSSWMGNRFEQALMKQRLSECALHLCALEVLMGRMGEARKAAALALRLGGGQHSMKRWLATFLPKVRVRKRLWPESEGFLDSSGLTDLADVRLP